MVFKVFVIAVLIAILVSLASALYHLVRSDGDREKLARALTVRISLSLALFILLIIAYGLGWITPHGVMPGAQ
ncbi:MAG: twin transmembrane helix small protein [Gammaproteobacteria bacterium]